MFIGCAPCAVAVCAIDRHANAVDTLTIAPSGFRYMLFKIKPADVSALDGLLDAAAYGATTSA